MLSFVDGAERAAHLPGAQVCLLRCENASSTLESVKLIRETLNPKNVFKIRRQVFRIALRLCCLSVPSSPLRVSDNGG